MQNTKTYKYSWFAKILNLSLVILLFSTVFLLFRNEHFREFPFIFAPIFIFFCSIYKLFKAKKVFTLYYKIDFDNETLETSGEIYDLKTMTTLNIKNIRDVERFTIVYAQPHPNKFDKLEINGRFPKFVELRNHIIEIGKKYDENLYALLKKQSM